MKKLALVSSKLRFCAVLILAVDCFAPMVVCGQTFGKRVFSTAGSCELSSLLTPSECRYAYGNALAELDEKAPRFASRDECQKIFKQCMIAGFGGGRVEFQPALRGFEVNVRSQTEKTVLPVVDGDGSSLGFRARSALKPDAGVSHSLRNQAQARWKQQQEAKAAAAVREPRFEKELGAGEPLDLQVSPSLAPEHREPTEYDRAAAERRRQELRAAPTVW